MRLLASVDVKASALTLTLTYPNAFDFDWKRWKRDLKVFYQRVRREWPSVTFAWKLEFQKRKAPHYHILVLGLGNKKQENLFMEEIPAWWCAVVDSGDVKHLGAGTSCERIRSRAGLLCYAAGYGAKMKQTLSGVNVGRYWGVLGRKSLPVGEVVEFDIPVQAYHQLMRIGRRFRVSCNRKSQVHRIARKEKVSFAEVMNRRARQELKGHRCYKLRCWNNATQYVFCDLTSDLAKWPDVVDFVVGGVERELNRHLDEPW
jgi:hypothetical protein